MFETLECLIIFQMNLSPQVLWHFPIRAGVAVVHYLSFHILPQRKGSIPDLEKLEMGQGDMSLRI